MKKPKFRRFGIGTGTKVQQANLRKLASDMANDPKMLIPKCESECSKCAFDKVQMKLQKIHSIRSNPATLKKLAGSGKQFERGYASMLILASENSPIMFATARLPSGDVNYTVRGKVKKETLIGFQHWDDPILRLLAYSEIVLKKDIHLYSSDNRLTCTGRNSKYPETLLSEILKSTGYSLRKSHGDYQCEHMAGHEGQSMKIKINSLGQSIQLCKSCTSRKANLYNELSGRVLAKNPGNDFDIVLKHDLKCKSGDNCTLSNTGINTTNLLSQYRMGQISDSDLLNEYSQLARDSLVNLGKPIFVLGNSCYEDDVQAFIDALNPSEIEELALKRVLKAAPEPIVLDTATPNAVLSIFWDKIGASAIYAVIGDKDLAKKIHQESRDSGKMPAQILRDAKIQVKSKNVLDALPDLNNLGKLGTHIDEVARTYKAMGKEEIIRLIDKAGKETKIKSINCGFFKALGAIKGKEWQFSKEELDYGNYLADFAKALLDSKPEEYKDAVQNLLTASGSGETVN